MAENTFLGLQPYTEADAYRFRGRSEESQELFRLIVRNDYTVCYAESGEGKTSLLNAGVFPLLRQNMYFPIAITFTSDDYECTPDSFDAIIDRCIKDSIADYNEKNKGVNIEYRLCSTDFQDADHQSALQQELSKFSWWKLRNYKPHVMGLIFTPVFVFDQFEEVFNLPGSIVWTKKFFDWLEDISADSCPDEIVDKVREIIGNDAAFPTIKEEKDFKAVFSLRKEFIGELDYWGMQQCFIPSLKDNRYCLKALTYEGAKKVMTQQERFEESKVKQVLDYFVQKYSREPQKTIAENLPSIPALLLSVVCDSWENDINYFSDIDADGIDDSLNKILEKFYDEVLSAIVKELFQQEANIQIDSISEDIETIMFSLVDGNGKRVRRKSSELSHLDFDAKYKEILSDKRIVKVSKVDGEDYVEIVHDALCPIIAKRKEIRLVEEAKAMEEERLLEQMKILRRRMLVGGLFLIAVMGILAIFLLQKGKIQKEKDARQLTEVEKDSIATLNRINEIQKDSLSRQLHINEIQRDSLNQKLHVEEILRLSLNNKNFQLERSLEQNKLQQQKIDKMDSVIVYAKLYNQGRKLQEIGRSAEAIDCFKKSADGNNPDALNVLADYYFKKDSGLAEFYARRGAIMGDEGCQLQLGRILYELGEKEEALRWLTKSAGQGNAQAAILAGEMYGLGDGVKVDRDQSIFWYRMAARTSGFYSFCAKEVLSNMDVKIYESGEAYMEAVHNEAVHNVQAQDYWGAEQLYHNGMSWFAFQEPEKFACLERSAKKGYYLAQKLLGEIFISSYAKDLGIYNEDLSQKWLSSAFDLAMRKAEAGDTIAYFIVGEMLEKGEGTTKNINKAIEWYKKSIMPPKFRTAS